MSSVIIQKIERVLIMKKKFLSISLMLVLLTGVASPTFAATDEDRAKAIEMIDKTNAEIDEEIEDAVEKADKLQEKFKEESHEITENEEIYDLKKEKNEIVEEIKTSKYDSKELRKAKTKVAELEVEITEKEMELSAEIEKINSELIELTELLIVAEGKESRKLNKKISKLHEKLNEKNSELAKLTEKYAEDLDKVITDVFDKTLKMSNETIAKAAERGVEAECSWKLIRFADQWVWIDPIRVVGRR